MHFPQLDANEALLIVAIYEKAIDAIWRAHGSAMTTQLAASAAQDPSTELVQCTGIRDHLLPDSNSDL